MFHDSLCISSSSSWHPEMPNHAVVCVTTELHQCVGSSSRCRSKCWVLVRCCTFRWSGPNLLPWWIPRIYSDITQQVARVIQKGNILQLDDYLQQCFYACSSFRRQLPSVVCNLMTSVWRHAIGTGHMLNGNSKLMRSSWMTYGWRHTLNDRENTGEMTREKNAPKSAVLPSIIQIYAC